MIRFWHRIRFLLAVGLVLATTRGQVPRCFASEGATITATVDADGTEPFTYQWRKSGVAVSGATARTLMLEPAVPPHSGTYDVVVSNEVGSTTAPPVELTIVARGVSVIRLNAQPTEQSVAFGGNASFAVVAVSEFGLPLAYQWRRDGLNLPGATDSTLTLRNVTMEQLGRYSVLVSTTAGSMLSEAVRLRLLGENPLPPAIVRQPQSVSLVSGGTLALTVSATPESSLSYQWLRNGVALPGATAATLLLANALAGSYTVRVSNSTGAIESSPAVVTHTSGEGRLANLSTCGPVGGNAGTLIAGFVIASGANKPVLLRGIGPGLSAFGIVEGLSDPRIDIYDASGRWLFANDTWDDKVEIGGAQAGAFPLPSGSRDAGLLAPLSPGPTTMHVSVGSGAGGMALAEVYDPDADRPESGRLTNLSSLGWVGTGDSSLVAGLVATGAASRTVMVRAVGPGLAVFAVEERLRRPVLQIFDAAQTPLATNSTWESGGMEKV